MRLRNAALLVAGLVLVSCGEEKDLTDVRVMTYNLAIGIELEPVLLAPLASIPALVDAAWAQKDVSDFSVRVQGIADGIEATQPDVVGLQEVIQFYQQVPGDGPPGVVPGATQATDLVEDFLVMLLDELANRGLVYEEAATVTNADIELTGASGNDYRVVDREALIVRQGVAFSNARGANYLHHLSVEVGGVIPFEYKRGWVAADVQKGGKTLTVFSTHLEAFDAGVQAQQAPELLALVDPAQPTVVVGDMNSDPADAAWPGYGLLVSPTTGLADAAAEVRAGAKTCCRDALTSDPDAPLERRVDLVLHTPHFEAKSISLFGTQQAEMVSSGGVGPLWPSDHAGVSALLGLE